MVNFGFRGHESKPLEYIVAAVATACNPKSDVFHQDMSLRDRGRNDAITWSSFE
jgi:hypothetical protein